MKNIHSNNSGEELDIQKIISVFIKSKWAVFSITSSISIIGVIFSLLLPNIYESKALLSPVNSSNGISSALQNYSGLAGIAGINLSSGSDEGNTVKALNKVKSLSFFENNILTNIKLPELMAVKSWDSKKGNLNFDESIYNINNKSWVRDFTYPQKQIPSVQESFKVFKKHLNISEDNKSGFITISIKHQSPLIAKQWTELIVNELNNFYRQKDKKQAEMAVSFLKEQLLITDLSEIRQVLSQLLQEEIKKLSLIEANDSYVFDYIDPPVVMEEKSEPRRLLLIILSTILGVMISILFILIKYYFFNEKIS